MNKCRSILALLLTMMLVMGAFAMPALAEKAQPKPASRIEVNKESLTLTVGKSGTLVVTVWALGDLDSGALAFNCFDMDGKPIPGADRIVSIKNEKNKKTEKIVFTFKGLEHGKFLFGLFADDIEKYIPVTVKPKSPLPAQSVTLNETEITLIKGKSFKLNATTGPDFASTKVTFKSDNKKVATVGSAGKVVGKKEGTATITVKTKSGVTATCKVTVVPKDYVPPTPDPEPTPTPEPTPDPVV